MWRTHDLVLPGKSWDTRSPYKERSEDAAAAWAIGETVVLVVADGLGSAARAAEAAALAMRITRDLAEQLAPRETNSTRMIRDQIFELFERVRASFLETVHQMDHQEQWQTTLTVVTVLDQAYLAYASLGDSILAIQHDALNETDSQRLRLVSSPRRRAGHRTDTYTLRDELRHAEIHVVHVPGMTGVLLATDGIEGLINVAPDEPEFVVRLDPSLHDVVHAVATGKTGRADDFFERDGPGSVRGEKGDDIGVAVAAWQ